MKEVACLHNNQGFDVLKDTRAENEAGCQGKIETKVSRQKTIIKVRAETNDIETRKTKK